VTPASLRRTCIVTGASSGIGRATTCALAARGHVVVLGARRAEVCRQIAGQIADGGGEAHAFPLDLADDRSIGDFVTEARKAVGDIEVLVSCAGRNLPDATLDASPGAFAASLAVNLVGPHRLVGLLAPAMMERRRGDLVFVTSEVARLPRPRNKAYVASKWGLEGYVRTLQMELEGTGVRASIVRPSQTLTEMGSDWDPVVTTEILEEWIRWGLARHNHFLEPEAVAGAVVAVVEAAPGTHLSLVEVQPEAPLPRDRPTVGGSP
jgi:NAD(P)-dependent dehydrogenase (short-subunit alcohol dehydrogenase family)